MKKISRKIIVAGLAAVIGIGGLSGTVLAAGTYQPVSLNSYGVFSYDDGNSNNNNGYKYDIFLDASDLTKINNNLNVLKTSVDSCFQSVSNGKALLASTLTGLGVSTSSDATFETINTNIQTLATNKYNAGVKAGKESISITVSGTAENQYILKDKTVTVNGVEKYKGTMPDNGATGTSNLAAGNSYTIPAGYTSGGTVSAASLESQTVGDASEEDIAFGKKAWVNGREVVGTAGGSSSNAPSAAGSCTLGTAEVVIDCGFKPTAIFVDYGASAATPNIAWYNSYALEGYTRRFHRNDTYPSMYDCTKTALPASGGVITSVSDSGFTMKMNSGSDSRTVYWFAMGELE